MSEHPDESLAALLTALTRDLILIRSTDALAAERARCFEFVRIQLEELEGVEIREYQRDGYASMLALPAGHEKPDVLLCGHLDVVDHGEADCYRSVVRDGRIIGPGAGDMKGGLAILIELFREQHHSRPGLSLGLAVTSDEECGGEHGVKFLVEELGLRAGQVIVPDGGSPNELTIEEKGIIHLRVRAVGHAAHAARPWLGDNALEKLIAGLERLGREFRQLRPADYESAGGPADHWFPSCAVTMLGSGNETANRVPSDAEAVLDVRFPPPADVAGVMETVRTCLGPDVQAEVIISAEPTHLAPDPEFVRATEEATGEPVRMVKSCGGSDARFFRAVGVPVNLSRPKVGELHSEEEWIEVDSMVKYYRICEEYLRRKVGK